MSPLDTFIVSPMVTPALSRKLLEISL